MAPGTDPWEYSEKLEAIARDQCRAALSGVGIVVGQGVGRREQRDVGMRCQPCFETS